MNLARIIAVIPALKLTDLGLVDGTTMRIVPLFEEEGDEL